MSGSKRKGTGSAERIIAGIVVALIVGMAVFSARVVVGLVF